MTLTTSNTKTFQLSVADIIEQAADMVGGQPLTGHDMEDARIKLNLIMIEIANEKIPLHTIEEITVALTAGTKDYSLGDVVDVVGETGNLSYSNKDYSIDRLPRKEYNRINNKLQQSRPTTFTVDRDSSEVVVTLWPVPDTAQTYSFKCLVSQHFDTVTASHQIIDAPRRFLPAIIAMLAHKLSLKREGIPQNRRLELQQNAQMLMQKALEEDGERTDLIVVPTKYKR